MSISKDSPLPLNFEEMQKPSFGRTAKKKLLINSNQNKYGIKTLKLIEEFKANLIKEIWSALDKFSKKGIKPSPFFAFRFLDDVIDLGKIINKRHEVEKEFKDLTKEELLELNKTFENAFNLDKFNEAGFDKEDFIERTNFMISVNTEYIFYLTSLKK